MEEKKIGLLLRAIRLTEKGLEKLRKQEKISRERWTKGYQRYIKAANDLADLKNIATKHAARIRSIIKSWKDETIALTHDRDEVREAIRQAEEKLRFEKLSLALLKARLQDESGWTDETVNQVFEYNDSAVSALRKRNEFLTAHVYKLLIDEKGQLRTQITLTSSNQKRRVVALVNHISRIDPVLAGDALKEIQKFFDRIAKADEVSGEQPDETVQALIGMLRNLLVEKVSFKVGPDLYRFISIEIDEDAFPELTRAQYMLRHSLRSEKTNSYVRLYRRESQENPWVEVKLT